MSISLRCPRMWCHLINCYANTIKHKLVISFRSRTFTSHTFNWHAYFQQIGFNGGVPITEDFFVVNIAGKHNEDIASVLFPDDHARGVKFLEDKEAMFRRFLSSPVDTYIYFYLKKRKRKRNAQLLSLTLALLFRVWYRIVKEKIEPVKGLYKLKKWIEDRGLKRAAVTNAPKENAELMISLLGLTDFFHAVILGSDCEHAKPFPDPYLKALELLKVSKEQTCIFEVLVQVQSLIHSFSQSVILVHFMTTATCFRILYQE